MTFLDPQGAFYANMTRELRIRKGRCADCKHSSSILYEGDMCSLTGPVVKSELIRREERLCGSAGNRWEAKA